CALFDFSFLETACVSGAGAKRAIEAFSGRALDKLKEQGICYAVRTNAAGEAVADLTIWRTGPSAFEIMSGRREDIADLMTQGADDVNIVDLAANRAVFALQGPRALDVLRKLADVTPVAALGYYRFASAEIAGIFCTVGRLGYTGEAG